MAVEILKRERLPSGWVRYLGAVDGVTKVRGQAIGVRLPVAYVDAASYTEAETEVKEALRSEYERLQRMGGAYVR
jgi:hypothetical protein